jgi:hypothetical protein
LQETFGEELIQGLQRWGKKERKKDEE